MNFYDDLVMQTQMNYSRHYPIYASGSTPYQLTDKKPLPYSEQIHRLVQEVKEADCVVVGGASGLSAAGGGDFYYEDNDSYRKYFRPFAEKYHFKGAFAGMMHPWKTREEYWGYLATFLHTTQTAPVRHSYLDLNALLKGKDFFILTTNQDTFPGVRTAVARLSPGCEDMGISCKERNMKNSTKKFLATYWNTKTAKFCSWSWALVE